MIRKRTRTNEKKWKILVLIRITSGDSTLSTKRKKCVYVFLYLLYIYTLTYIDESESTICHHVKFLWQSHAIRELSLTNSFIELKSFCISALLNNRTHEWIDIMTLKKIVLRWTCDCLLETFLFITPCDHITVVENVKYFSMNIRHTNPFGFVHFRMTICNTRTTDGNNDRSFVPEGWTSKFS